MTCAFARWKSAWIGAVLLALGSLTLATSAWDGTEDDCNSIIIGNPANGLTCDYHDWCPGETEACKKVTDSCPEGSVTTCACADESTTDCCAYYWVFVEETEEEYEVLAGDCDPPDSNCETGTCQDQPIPVPRGCPPKKKADCR